MSSAQRVIKIFAYILAIAIVCIVTNWVFIAVDIFVPTTEKILVDDYSKSFKDIKELNLDIGAAELVITEGEELKVEAKDLTAKLKVKESDNVLTIKQKKKVARTKLGTITITVPSKMDSIVLNGGLGSVDISNIQAKSTIFKIGLGNVKIDGVIFDKSKMDGGAGNITITHSEINNLDLEAGAGNIRIDAKILGDSSIDCGLGKISLTLLGGEDLYRLKASKGLGELTINNKNYGDEVTYGEGKNLIEVEGGVGSININFRR